MSDSPSLSVKGCSDNSVKGVSSHCSPKAKDRFIAFVLYIICENSILWDSDANILRIIKER